MLKSLGSNAVIYSDSAPIPTRLGQLWVDTDAGPPELMIAVDLSPPTFAPISGGGGGSPGGSPGEIQFNDSGSFGGAEDTLYSEYLGILQAPQLDPDQPPIVTDDADDEFVGNALDTAGTRFPGAIPWAWVNQGSATAVFGNGNLTMALISTSDETRLIVQAVSGSAWRFRAKCSGVMMEAADYLGFGPIVQNSITGEVAWMKQVYFTNQFIYAETAANPSSGGSSFGSTQLFVRQFPLYFEIERNGVNLTFRVSYSGADGSFKDVGTVDITTPLSGSIDRIGVCADCGNGSDSWISWDWFRRMA